MRKIAVITGFALPLFILLNQACIRIGDTQTCEESSACPTKQVCIRGFCVPSYFLESTIEKVGNEQNGGSERSQEMFRDGFQADAGHVPEKQILEIKKEQTPESTLQPEHCTTSCPLGKTERCYPNGKTGCPAGSSCEGVCQRGTKYCHLSSSGCPVWSECFGSVTPQQEECNNKDDDCDGQIDESMKRTCYSGTNDTKNVGICREGSQTCTNGSWASCQNEQLPQKETCDGKDNDCNGQTDEGCGCQPNQTQTCGVSDTGACQKGTQTCSAQGQWGTCVGETKASTETCNNQDDDCDGQTDESLSKPCYSGPQGTEGKGVCKGGTQTCQAGAWSACSGEVVPSKDDCDGKDNDCDGQLDEDFIWKGRGCTSAGKGICKPGIWHCVGGTPTCKIVISPQDEICDKKDNNCNGLIDDIHSPIILPTKNSSPSPGDLKLASDSSGNIFVSVSYSKQITIGTKTYTPQGNIETILLKATPQGTVSWSVRMTGNGISRVHQIATNTKGELYVVGQTSAENTNTIIKVGSQSTHQMTPKTQSCFVLHINSLGTVQNVVFDKSTKGLGQRSSCESIQISKSGSVYISGSFTQEIHLSNNINQTTQSNGFEEGFVAKLSADLKTVNWFKKIVSASSSFALVSGVRITLDESSGKIYVGSSFSGKIQTNTGSVERTTPENLLIGELAQQGSNSLLWAIASNNKTGQSPMAIIMRGVKVNGANIYISGEQDGGTFTLGGKTSAVTTGKQGTFFASIDANTKKANWLYNLDISKASVHTTSMLLGKEYLIVGHFTGSLTVGSTTFPATTGTSLFSAHLNTQNGTPTKAYQTANIPTINAVGFGSMTFSSKHNLLRVGGFADKTFKVGNTTFPITSPSYLIFSYPSHGSWTCP